VEHLRTPTVDVFGKRTVEYMLECLTSFNRGADEVRLRAFGGNVSKGVNIAHLMADAFNIGTGDMALRTLEIERYSYLCLEIALRALGDLGTGDIAKYATDPHFVDLPVYHLLLDTVLAEKGRLHVTREDDTPLVDIARAGYSIRCEPAGRGEPDQGTLNNLAEAYFRCGLLSSRNWKEIAATLSAHDDIILGLDTNILHGAVLSEHLLDSLSLMDPKEVVHTPNWILIIVPSAVMHELEQAANRRDAVGHLEFQGRMGFRAIQEILELDRSADLTGISLMIVGRSDPTLDTRTELRGLREDLERAGLHKAGARARTRLSTGDTVIRDQFKSFLRSIDFHKGVFFLTADKSNAAIARAEGLHAIYYHIPPWYEAKKAVSPPAMPFNDGRERVTVPVPLGKILYELAVQFGTIVVRWDTGKVQLQCDGKGDSLDHWIQRELMITDKDQFRRLLSVYAGAGRFNLIHVRSVWKDLCDRLCGEF